MRQRVGRRQDFYIANGLNNAVSAVVFLVEAFLIFIAASSSVRAAIRLGGRSFHRDGIEPPGRHSFKSRQGIIKFLSCALLVGTSVALTGCATGGNLAPQATADVNSWAATAEAQAAAMDAGAPVNQPDAAAPQAVLATASLVELYQRGVDYNPTIKAARARVAVADAELTNAVFRFFPSLTGTATRTHTYQNILDSDNQVFQQGWADYGTSNAALEARIPLFNLENVFNLKKIDAQQRMSYVEYVGAAQTFTRDLMIAYVDLAEINAIIDEYRDRVQLLSTRASSERQRQSAGGGGVEIALGFEQELSDARAQLNVQQARLQGVIIRIEQLTGAEIGAVRGHVPLASLSLPVDNLDGLIALALSNNPHYIAKTYEVQAFDEEISRAMASDFAPTVDGFATYEWEDRAGSQFGGGSETVQTVVGFQLTVPLFNSGGSGYQSNTAIARNQQISAELAMVASETRAAVATAYANYQAARGRIQQDDNTVRTGSQLISLINQRVADSGGTMYDDLDARLDQASYQRQRQQAQFQLLREWVNIQHLTGALSEADVQIFSGTNI